uniref:Uncharacterized protein n=1 Tax=Arundo donax TaxID=35708 RepID=A0A0A9GZJ7_ARUDO
MEIEQGQPRTPGIITFKAAWRFEENHRDYRYTRLLHAELRQCNYLQKLAHSFTKHFLYIFYFSPVT